MNALLSLNPGELTWHGHGVERPVVRLCIRSWKILREVRLRPRELGNGHRGEGQGACLQREDRDVTGKTREQWDERTKGGDS